MRRILIIAASEEVRRSAAFALGAEGYVVTSRDRIVTPYDARGYDCVILEQRAAAAMPRDAIERFCALSPPVILLAFRSDTGLSSFVHCVVETPDLGQGLVSAVDATTSDAVPANTAAFSLAEAASCH